MCLPDSCDEKEDFKQFLHAVIPKNKTTHEPVTYYDVGPSQTKDDKFEWLGVDIAFLQDIKKLYALLDGVENHFFTHALSGEIIFCPQFRGV